MSKVLKWVEFDKINEDHGAGIFRKMAKVGDVEGLRSGLKHGLDPNVSNGMLMRWSFR